MARIRAHLDWVAAALSVCDVPHLDALTRARRGRLLGGLRAYSARGCFPRNEHCAGRRPVFIDDAGRICAVGHLMEISVGRGLPERVAAAHRHAYVHEIDSPEVADWAAVHGFTPRELAMIQPTYGFAEPHNILSATRLSFVAALVALALGVLAVVAAVQLLRRFRDEHVLTRPLLAFATIAIGGPVAVFLYMLPSLFRSGSMREWVALVVVVSPSLAFLGVLAWSRDDWPWGSARRVTTLLFVLGFGALPWYQIARSLPWTMRAADIDNCRGELRYAFYYARSELLTGRGTSIVRHGWTHRTLPTGEELSGYYLFGHHVSGDVIDEVISCPEPHDARR